MPITETLKKLIKTITGKDAAGETIEELVTNLAENYSGTAHNEADILLDVDKLRAAPYDLQALLDVWNERPLIVKAFALADKSQAFYTVATIGYRTGPEPHIAVTLNDEHTFLVYPDGTVRDDSVN